MGVACILLIFGLVLLQAAQRYLPIDGWPWTGELARFGLVWLTFVVAGVLVTRTPTSRIEMSTRSATSSSSAWFGSSRA